MDSPRLRDAYAICWQIACRHYENFPIGSLLLPRPLRRHLAAIYAFARIADDYADEGTRSRGERLALLDAWERQLDQAYRGAPSSPVFVALADTVERFAIPPEPFRALLEAFRYDADFRPFPSFADLRNYCRHSADPVGHLVLYLFGYRDRERQALADEVCTGLQLANFWQDLAIDTAKGRLYVPLADLEQFGVIPEQVCAGPRDERVRSLIAFQVDRARGFLQRGLALSQRVDRRLAREVRLFALGGLAILERIEKSDFDVFSSRPTLSRWDRVRLLALAATGRNGRHAKPAASTLLPASLPSSPAGSAIADDYRHCEEVTRRSSSNFYYAFLLLPPEKRRALCAVYAFCRFVDDIADQGASRAPARLLERWREELDEVFAGTPRHPISRALADTVRRFPLRKEHFVDLIAGVEADLSGAHYESWDDLRTYCYRVAGTVGLLCIEIFGYQNPSARQYAVDLGIAFQLTNILRDVREDAERGRVYLPASDLHQFGCQREDLLTGDYSPKVAALLAFECGRARAYYLRAHAALAPEDRASLAPAEAMRAIYQRLLNRIEQRNFDVFHGRITLPRYEKMTLALAAWSRARWAAARAS